jgi:iron complex outermembrane receptor protein
MNIQLTKLKQGILFSLALLAGFIVNAQAPTAVIKGVISEPSGNALSGATVKVERLNKTSITDSKGNYAITLPEGTYTLLVSYAGQLSQKISVHATASKTSIQNIVLLNNNQTQEGVTVVGTRNPKRSATETAVPIDIIPLKQLSNQVGQLDITQLLTYLAPSFNSVRQALGDGTDHIDPAQLRGLGPDQVLVLVNGKRYHQSSLVNVNGTVNRGTIGTDLNSIPASSIERIEILRDGAAAQYGSDAIAGVINIVLKKEAGFSINSSVGANVTSYDKNYAWNKLHPANALADKVKLTDGENIQLSVNYGLPIKKGFLALTAEYLQRNSSNRTGLYTGQIWPTVGGVDKSDSINASKGLTRDNFDLRLGNSNIKGGGLVANFAYPVSSSLELYAFGVANYKKGNAGGLYRYPNSIRVGGSFPSSNSASAAAVAYVLALYPNGFLPEEDSKVRDYSITAGLRGKLGSWQLDASETFGSNSYEYLVSKSVNYTQSYLPGVTAASLQTAFNSGKTTSYQAITNIDLSKNHQVLAGLNTALGAEFRVEGYGIVAGEYNSFANLTTDKALAGIAGAQVFAGFLPENAGSWSRSNIALYSDNELDITKKWLLTAALRFENYSDFGATLNYKLSTRYKLTDQISLRGSASSGFRAPSLQQQHYSKVTTQFVNIAGTLTPVQAGTFTNDSKVAEILGIPALKEEKSQSFSVGATAKIAKGLDITIDAYQIDIKNRIILSNSFSGGNNAALTAALNAAGAATASVFANGIDTRSRGLEAVLSYNTQWGKNQSLHLSLAHATVQNRVKRDANDKVIIHGSDILINSGQLSKYFNRLDQSRIETQSPQIKEVFAAQYKIGKFGTFLRFTYFGKVSFLADTTGGISKAGNAFNANTIETIDQVFSGKWLTDLSFNYAVYKNITVTLGANNLFDQYPDKQTHYNNTSTGRFTYSRAVSQFGYNGRYLFAKLAVNL